MPNFRVLASILTDIFNFVTHSVTQSVSHSATPGKSDIRTGEEIRSTFSFGIPNIVDKEEKPVEPTQQEQESKTQKVDP